MYLNKLSFLLIVFFITACDSSFEVNIGKDDEVNQICITDIYGGGERYFDISNVIKDCRKGEILTANVILWDEVNLSDIRDYEHRLSYLISKVCDFNKQIIVQEVPHNFPSGSEFLHSYDLSCAYSGGFNFPGAKWIEEMKE
tara:strand:+ start:189 stop:614 length:426 start_codon:yes stop_codon:yes gene_type:complete